MKRNLDFKDITQRSHYYLQAQGIMTHFYLRGYSDIDVHLSGQGIKIQVITHSRGEEWEARLAAEHIVPILWGIHSERIGSLQEYIAVITIKREFE